MTLKKFVSFLKVAFKMGSRIGQVSQELDELEDDSEAPIILLPPLECWDYRHAFHHLFEAMLGICLVRLVLLSDLNLQFLEE